jgi:hypothetical protein
VEFKIKWIKRKQMTHENTYCDDRPRFVKVCEEIRLEIQAGRKCLRKTIFNEIKLTPSMAHALVSINWKVHNPRNITWIVDLPIGIVID